MKTTFKNLREFLLGIADESAIGEIENGILGGEISPEELEFAEDSLIEEYLEGRLSPSETSCFRRSFLISEERRNRLKNTAALRRTAQNAAVRDAAVGAVPTAKPNGWLRVFGSTRPRFALFGAAALAATVLVVALVWIRSGVSEEMRLLQAKYTEINQRGTPEIAGLSADTAPSLFPATRGSENVQAVHLSNSEDIVLRLALNDTAAPKYRIKIERRNQERFELDSLSPIGRELRVTVPRSIFNPGPVRIIAEPSNQTQPSIYEFIAE